MNIPVGTELLDKYLKHGVRQLEELEGKGLVKEALETLIPNHGSNIVFGSRTNEHVEFSFVYLPANLKVFVDIYHKGEHQTAHVVLSTTNDSGDILVSSTSKGSSFTVFGKNGQGLAVKIHRDASVSINPVARAFQGKEVKEDFALELGSEELISTMGPE